MTVDPNTAVKLRDILDTMIAGCRATKLLYAGTDYDAVKSRQATLRPGVIVAPWLPGAQLGSYHGVFVADAFDAMAVPDAVAAVKAFVTAIPIRATARRSFIVVAAPASHGVAITTVLKSLWRENLVIITRFAN